MAVQGWGGMMLFCECLRCGLPACLMIAGPAAAIRGSPMANCQAWLSDGLSEEACTVACFGARSSEQPSGCPQADTRLIV